MISESRSVVALGEFGCQELYRRAKEVSVSRHSSFSSGGEGRGRRLNDSIPDSVSTLYRSGHAGRAAV